MFVISPAELVIVYVTDYSGVYVFHVCFDLLVVYSVACCVVMWCSSGVGSYDFCL